MKKLSLTLLTVICTFCMALGAISMINVSTAKAEAEPAQVALSATAYKRSVNKDKLLLVTAIKNYEDVYEIGYTFSGDVTEISAAKTNYYTQISGASKTWTVTDIFDEEYENAVMIVWEIEYSPANAYTCQAYAKYGNRDKNGDLIKNDPETIEYGTEKTIAIETHTVSIDMDGGKLLNGKTEITSLTVNYGDTIDLSKYTAQKDYNQFVKWQYSTNGSAYADFAADTPIVEDMTLKAIWKVAYSVEQGVTQSYSNSTSITGTKYTVSATNYAISVAKNEAFKGSLVSFGYCNNGGNYQIGKFTVRITDVTTEKALELIFVLNGDSVAADSVYAGWSYDGVDKAPVAGATLGIDLSDKGSGAWWGSQLTRTMTISVGEDGDGNQSILFNNGFTEGSWNKYFYGDKALDLTGFGADGVDIEVEINAFNNCNAGSFIIIPKYTTTENVTHNYGDNQSITGTKYTVSATNYAISVAEGKAFTGDLITFGYCNNGGNYQIGKFTVRITDVTTEKALELIFVLNGDSVAADSVYAGWSYDGVDKAPVAGATLGIDMSDKGSGTWYGSQLTRTMTISVGEDGDGNQSILFNNGFTEGSWNKYFYGDKALDLTGFGANGVDIEVEINELNNCSTGSFIIG